VERYAHSLYYFIYGYVRDAAQAEDSTQDTFVKMWKNVKRFDETKRFKTWLFSIAKNTALDALKKKRTLPFSALESDEEEQSFIETIVDPDAFLNDLFEKQENAQLLSRAIDTLSEKYRTVVYLHNSEGLTFLEIAEVLKGPIDTIKSRHRRALGILKNKLIQAGYAP